MREPNVLNIVKHLHRNVSNFAARAILIAAALACVCGTVRAQAKPKSDSPADAPLPRDAAPQLSQPSGLAKENWEQDDILPGEITAAQDPELAPIQQYSEFNGPNEPRPQSHAPRHGDAPPGEPCGCQSCRAGPLGLGIGPWLRDLLMLDQGAFTWEDRGPGPYESWDHRPYGVSFMAGVYTGDTLIDGEQEMSSSGTWEVRAAHPITDEFTIEARWGRATGRDEDLINGGSVGDVDVFMGDIMLQFTMSNRYIHLTERFQPYLAFGGGFAIFDFVNLNDVQINPTVFIVPIGIGFRYRFNDAWAIRGELRDNISPGGPLATMNNIAFTAGVEWRFGGSKPSYGMWELR